MNPETPIDNVVQQTRGIKSWRSWNIQLGSWPDTRCLADFIRALDHKTPFP